MTIERYPEWWIVRIDGGERLRLEGPDGAPLCCGRLAGYYVAQDGDGLWCEDVAPSSRTALYHRIGAYRPDDPRVVPTFTKNPTRSPDPFDAVGVEIVDDGARALRSDYAQVQTTLTRRADGRFDCVLRTTLHDAAGPSSRDDEVSIVDVAVARAMVRRFIEENVAADPLPRVRMRTDQ